MNQANQVLKETFGHDAFRPGQAELVEALLAGRDCVGVMPTGAGKSVCYQVPALLRPGVALVISPLISLMKDQVQALIAQGVPAAFINSTLTPRQTDLALERAAQGAYRIVYVAPERLESAAFRAFARAARLSLIAVDEAHCVSQWGQDFRPHYLRIADFVDSLPQRPPLGAFTATATARVREDIIRLLRLRDPRVAMTGFDRPNLWFEVIRPGHKDAALLEILRRQEGKSGIVYCATRKNVERVAERLQGLGFPVARYHAGLGDAERRQAQEDFQYDRVQVMVATNAFGMGIDKSNVSFVIHYNMPKSMEAYYQEAGRAGRDGEPAECVLLYSPADTITARYLIQHGEPNPDLNPEERRLVRQGDLNRLQQMDRYCQQTGCLRGWILRYFGQAAPEKCDGCSACAGARYAFAAVAEDKRLRSAMRVHRVIPDPDTSVFAPVDDFIPPEEDQPLSGLDALLPARPETLPMKEGWRPGDAPRKETLFDALKAVRARLARMHRMPPYIICEDRTLRDMAEQKPQRPEELLWVHGMGERRVEKYGKPFLQAIGEWLKKHPEDRPAPKKDKPCESAWTAEEKAILGRAVRLKLNWQKISVLFDRPMAEVKRQAGALGLDGPEARMSAYEPWSEGEDGRLRQETAENRSLKEMAEGHGRTDGAIRSRIRKITEDAEADGETNPG